MNADDPRWAHAPGDAPSNIVGESPSRPHLAGGWLVKVGGSLLDVDQLGPRLRRWLDEHAPPESALIPGGGPTTDVIRAMDRLHGLGVAAAHRLAIQALGLNSHLLAALVPRGAVAASPEQCRQLWHEGKTPVLDPAAFLLGHQGQDCDALPASWDVTSDSIAARLAESLGIAHLVLLKSCSAPAGSTIPDWVSAGLVDPWFGQVCRRLSSVRLIDFRSLA